MDHERLMRVAEQGHRTAQATHRIGRRIEDLELRMASVEGRVAALADAVCANTEALRANADSSARLARVLTEVEQRLAVISRQMHQDRRAWPRLIGGAILALFVAIASMAAWLWIMVAPNAGHIMLWFMHFLSEGVPPT